MNENEKSRNKTAFDSINTRINSLSDKPAPALGKENSSDLTKEIYDKIALRISKLK